MTGENGFVCQIQGFPLMKIQSREIIEKLQKGSFRMNSLKLYRDKYRDGKDDGIGDPYEGKLFVHSGIVTNEKSGIKEELIDCPIATVNENDFVFCMFGVNPKRHCFFDFTEEQKEKLVAFNEATLLIKDTHEFFRRVKKCADMRGLKVINNFVNYYDDTSDDITRLIHLLIHGTHNIVFYKRQQYFYQQEYRFTIQNNSDDAFIELDIGDITDISEIFTTKEILSSTFVKS